MDGTLLHDFQGSVPGGFRALERDSKIVATAGEGLGYFLQPSAFIEWSAITHYAALSQAI